MNSTDTDIPTQYDTIFNDFSRRFWFFLVIILTTPTLGSFIFNFYCFIQHLTVLLFNNINHHTILCLLINDIIQIISCQPLTLIYLYFGHMKFVFSQIFCSLWICVEYTFVTQASILAM